MPRLQPVDPATADANAAAQLDVTRRMFGSTPNMFATAAQAPAALESMNAAFGALGRGRIGGKLGERIAIAVAQANQCEYCLAAHTAIGGMHGVSAAELASARLGRSAEPRAQAAITFALDLLATRGRVTDRAIAEARRAGLEDPDLVEIVAHVALNVYTNTLNNLAHTAVDFPPVALEPAA